MAVKQFEPRLNFKAPLEVEDKVIVGVGKNPTSFKHYWDLMPDNKKPKLYSTYLGLNNRSMKKWFSDLKKELIRYGDYDLIPQIGLSMTVEGEPGKHFEDGVADGKYQRQLTALINGIESLECPVFIRIGYSFNGVAWNGYNRRTFKKAYKVVSTKLRETNLPIANVWSFTPDGIEDFMGFYPGNEYVDWWGIEPLEAKAFDNSITAAFLEKAKEHGKPVMVGETTPKFVGATNGENSWKNWYEPFFNFVNANPVIKSFNYLNTDWNQFENTTDWEDARLEKDGVVSKKYVQGLTLKNFEYSSK